ncbi:MAG TPA: methyl-accepting chemotaxis protein [Clostridiaceae bacterium]
MKSIKGKITMMAVVISTLCMLMLSVICYYNAKQSITAETLSKIRNQSNTYAATIDGWFEMQGEILKEVGSEVQSNKSIGKTAMQAYFDREMENNPEFAAVYVGYADKTLVTDSNSVSLTPENYDPTTRDWYKEAVKQGKLIYTAPYKDAFSGKMVITIAEPVKSGGEIIGVTGADIFVDYLTNLTTKAKSGEGSYGFLLDGSKNFIVHENNLFQPTVAGSSNFGTVLDGRFSAIAGKLDGSNNTVTIVQDYDGISKYYVTSKIDTTGWTFGFAVPESQVMQPLKSLQSQFIIYIGLSIIIMIMLLIWLLGRTFKPLNLMISKVERIARGDFTKDEKQASHYSDDEIGRLNMSINNMQGELRSFMVGLMGSAQNLSASAEELSATVEELTSKAISIKESVDDIADGVQDSSAASQEISASMEEVDSSINVLSQKALEGSNNASGAKVRALDVKEKSDKAIEATRKIYDEKKNKMMKAIEDGKVVENIKMMADAIANIADQTNLLALNAAIEAARAGEHGRGFAVVAEEVRKLAEQSSQAVSSIQETISQVQSAFRSSIDTSSDILAFINNDVNKQFDAYSTTGKQYYSDSDFVSKMSDEIASMSEEITATVEQVNGAIQNLSESAQVSNEKTESIKENIDETTKAIEQVAYTAQDQAEMAQLLNEMVQKFKI